jgi:hypothetical protein
MKRLVRRMLRRLPKRRLGCFDDVCGVVIG